MISAALLSALIAVESGGNARAINRQEHAYGCLQIRQPVLDDVRVLAGFRFELTDCLHQDIAVKICHVYLHHWGEHYARTTGNDPTDEIYARIWAGGPFGWKRDTTLPYWHKVQTQLLSSARLPVGDTRPATSEPATPEEAAAVSTRSTANQGLLAPTESPSGISLSGGG